MGLLQNLYRTVIGLLEDCYWSARRLLQDSYRTVTVRAALLPHPPAPNMTDGLLVLVQLVMAAITTEPWLRVYSLPPKTKGIIAV